MTCQVSCLSFLFLDRNNEFLFYKNEKKLLKVYSQIKNDMSDLHSLYIECRRDLGYKGRETVDNVHGFLKRLFKKKWIDSRIF